MGSTTSDGEPPESDIAGWLQTFVPPIALELDGRIACPGHVAVEGSVLSADIAGFTSLAERLASSGKEGSEQLNVVVNSRIRALIEVSQRYGGGILKFGGDGILVLFKDEDHARRAVATGLEMHRALAEFDATSSDKSSELADEALSISVGIAEGPFDLFLVGNSEAKDLLIAGPAADAVVALESAAESGETVVSAATATAVGASTDSVASRGDGFVLSEDDVNVGDLMAPADRDTHPLEIVRPYVRSAVEAQVRVDQPLGGEHRLAAVGFVAVAGVSDRLTQGNIGAVTADLSRLFETVVNICDRTGVHLLETDIHPGGIKFLLAAGVPISHSNPSDAMLTAALDIVAMQSSLPGLGISCGVSRGRLFGALVGSPTRHSFTVVGDDTNIAARLANAASDGTVVATKRALNRARAVFTSEALGPMMVKGKAMPIDCVKVSSRPVEAKASSRAAQFVGRAKEVTTLTDAVASAGATLLIGGPGSGKTSLLAEAIHRTASQGIFVVQATCSPLENTSPYGVTRELLRKIIGIDLYAPDDDAGEQLHKVVAGEAPSMLDLLPLLATAMRATVPSTATVDALADEFRRERTEEVVVEFVDAMRFGQPLSIVIDDLQWIDEASSGVISALAGAATSRGWSVIGSRRPSTDAVPIFEPDAEIALDLQPDDEIRRIIIANSPEPLGDHALNRLVARAAGSPLFAEQLAAVADGRAGSASAELPESVEQLLITRFDHLDPDVRHAVRTASVFGQQGELDELTAVSDVTGAAGLLERADGFVTVVPNEDGGGRFIFESQLYRDTAYEGLAYSDRRRLHLAIGEHIETSVSGADRSDELARHFSLAGDEDRGWSYGLQAAERAAASYAWVDAAAVLRSVLDQAGSRNADDLASLAELRGEYLLSASSYADAEAAFAEAISLDPKSPRVASRSIRSATAVLRQGRYSEALETLGGLLDESELGTADRAEAMMAMCSAHFAQNELEDAYKLAVDVLAIADVELDPLTVARAEMRVHAISDGTGRSHEEHGARALALFQEHKDLALAAEVTNNLGAAAYYAGDWETAELRYREALDLKIRAGDYSGASVARANLAELLIERGISADVEELLFESERNFEASGLAAGVLFIAVLKGRLLLLLDEPGAAAALFEEVAATYLQYEAHASALETSGYQAEALLIAGDIDRADELSASVVEQIRQQSDSFEDRDRSLCRIELVRGAVKASSSPIMARGHWREAASLAEASGADDLAHVAACLLATSGEQRAEPLDALRRRGIEKVPLLEHLGRGFS